MTNLRDRCRLVLIAPDIEDAAERARVVGNALKGGDAATVIVPGYGRSDDEFQRHAEALVPVIQAAGAAALIVNDSRVAGRAKADGMHIDAPFAELADAVEKFRPKLIVGAGRVSDRHQALEVGELDPDYVFFGKIGGDIKPEPHPKNLALGEWWASMVSIPCIIMGGTDPASVLAIAETGAEFAALSAAVFAEPGRAAIVVAEANALLDEKAPRFE